MFNKNLKKQIEDDRQMIATLLCCNKRLSQDVENANNHIVRLTEKNEQLAQQLQDALELINILNASGNRG